MRIFQYPNSYKMLRSHYIRVHFNPFPTERILLLPYLWWWGHVTSPQSRFLHGGWMSKTVKSCCPNTAWNYSKQSLLEMCMRFHAMKAPAANSNAIYLRSCGNLRPKEQTHMRKENLECFQEACHTTLWTMVRSMIFDKKGEVQPPNVQIQTSLTLLFPSFAAPYHPRYVLSRWFSEISYLVW